MFVNINADAKKPIIKQNLLLGSSLCIGLSSLVNLKPWTNLRDNQLNPRCAVVILARNFFTRKSLAE